MDIKNGNFVLGSIIVIMSISVAILAINLFDKMNSDASVPNGLIVGIIAFAGLGWIANKFGLIKEPPLKELKPICMNCDKRIPSSEESPLKVGFTIGFDPQGYLGFICLTCKDILCNECHDVRKNLFVCRKCGKLVVGLHEKYLRASRH